MITFNPDWTVLDLRWYPHSAQWEAYAANNTHWFKATGPTAETAFAALHNNYNNGINLKELQKVNYSAERAKARSRINVPDISLDDFDLNL